MTMHLPSDKHDKHELTIREYRRRLFWKTVMWNVLFGIVVCAVMFGVAALLTGEMSSCITFVIAVLLIPIILDIAVRLTKETDTTHWMKK